MSNANHWSGVESDHYVVLGVPEGATAAEIKRAYRALARAYHPDRNPDPGAADLYLRVAEAHRVLGSERTRAAYDRARVPVAAARIVSADGAEIRLGGRLGAGDRSRVYRVSGRPGIVAKIYDGGATQAERENLARLAAVDPPRAVRLRETGQEVPTLAWPEELLFRDGRVQGYLMAEHPPGAVPWELLARPATDTAWPAKLNTFVRLHLAMNLAFLLTQVHDAGLLVGDLNLRDTYLAPSLVVTLGGCDAFVAPGPDRMPVAFTPGFAAPELGEGAPFSVASDTFALAALVYVALAGSPPFLPGAARARRDLSGPELAPLRGALERALRRGVRDPAARPTSREWMGVLQRCARGLAKAGNQEV